MLNNLLRVSLIIEITLSSFFCIMPIHLFKRDGGSVVKLYKPTCGMERSNFSRAITSTSLLYRRRRICVDKKTGAY